MKLNGPGEGSRAVEDKVSQCREFYDRLQKLTEDRGIQIGMTLAQEEELQSRLEDMLVILDRRKEEFGNLLPISVHPNAVQEQLAELKVSNTPL